MNKAHSEGRSPFAVRDDAVLRLFVVARRKSLAWTLKRLARELAIDEGSVRAAETARPVAGVDLLVLLQWTGLRGTAIGHSLTKAACERSAKSLSKIERAA